MNVLKQSISKPVVLYCKCGISGKQRNVHFSFLNGSLSPSRPLIESGLKRHRHAAVTVKLVEPLPVLPALSVAVAL